MLGSLKITVCPHSSGDAIDDLKLDVNYPVLLSEALKMTMPRSIFEKQNSEFFIRLSKKAEDGLVLKLRHHYTIQESWNQESAEKRESVAKITGIWAEGGQLAPREGRLFKTLIPGGEKPLQYAERFDEVIFSYPVAEREKISTRPLPSEEPVTESSSGLPQVQQPTATTSPASTNQKKVDGTYQQQKPQPPQEGVAVATTPSSSSKSSWFTALLELPGRLFRWIRETLSSIFS